jgi:hypothetical protein
LKKLIALDLDGTLLNRNSEISGENIRAIRDAQNHGMEVVIATGRAHFDVREIFKDTGIRTWVIAANGATIHDPEGKLFFSVPLDKDRAVEILAWLEREGYYYEVISDAAIFTPQTAREILAVEMDRLKSANPELDVEELKESAEKQYGQFGFSFISSYQDLLDPSIPVYNILAFSFDEEKLKNGKEKFKDCRDLTLVSSAKYNFELEHVEASKGKALHRLATELGIPMSETVAVGDSLNDCSMIAAAGTGIAMGNAAEEVKKIADEVTLTNDEHGVAHAIRRMLQEAGAEK